MNRLNPAEVGFATRKLLANMGYAARLFLRLVSLMGPTLRRFGLVRDQIHFLGNYSLAIIAVSGLFVGFVFGLQGYYTLQRYGSSEALGLLVALSLVRDIVLMKLNAVGLRGAYDLMPSQISGGMARRVALARAVALDPELIMYDEPLTGLDPISVGTAARLIRQLNDSMGLTSIFVSHEIEHTFAMADHVIILANGRMACEGTPDEVRSSDDPLVYQYVNALSEGPVRFHYPGASVAEDFGLARGAAAGARI